VIETAFYPMPSMLYVKLKSEVRINNRFQIRHSKSEVTGRSVVCGGFDDINNDMSNQAPAGWNELLSECPTNRHREQTRAEIGLKPFL
jgi:hypothetical protein